MTRSTTTLAANGPARPKTVISRDAATTDAASRRLARSR